MSHQVVYAIHNFEAENDDEINFRIGDPIVVVERDDKYMDGWWQGRNIHGHTGLFPMNYVSPEKPQIPYKHNNTFSTATTHNDLLASKIDNVISHVSSSSPGQHQSRPEAWSTAEVAAWLESLGHGALAPIFVEQEITGDILLDLTMDAMKELGVSTYGKRHKIMHAIADLKPSSSITTINNPPPPAKHHHRISRALPTDPPSPIPSSSNGSGSSSTRSRTVTADEHHHLPSLRPISPQSMLSSPTVSRSNTFNTMSSKKSSSTTSGTLHSEDRSRFMSTARGSPNQHHSDSTFDGMTTCSSAPSTLSKSHNHDWMAESSISSASSMEDHAMDSASAARKASVAASPDQHQSISSVSSTPPDTFQTPEHEGWLHKQSDRFKTWNKRWFVLKGSNLFYFKSPKDVRMKGIINLRGYRVVVDESVHSNKYCFKAQHDRERTFCFYTDSEESMRKWVNVLMKTTIARDISTPVVSSNPVATVSLEVARRMRPRPPSMIMYNAATNTVSNSKAAPLPQLAEGGVSENDMSSSSSNKMGVVVEEESDSEEYLDWVNSHLSYPVRGLTTAFRDGEQLIELLESLSGKRVPRPHAPDNEPLGDMQMLDTLVAAFKFMGREGIDVDGQFTIKDIFGGDEDKILVMLDAIRVCWSSTGP